MAAAAIVPWLKAVPVNYIHRLWWRQQREQAVLREFGRGQRAKEDSLPRQAEARLFLDRLSQRLKGSDRYLLALMRRDFRLSEAGPRLGIPKGSEQFRLRNLKKEARRIRQPSLLVRPRPQVRS